MSSRRARGRGNSRGGRQQNIRNQQMDSNGPGGRIRGTPQQVLDRYLTLARDASSSGDNTVLVENLLQHAEHYTRLLNAAAPAQQQNQQNQGNSRDDQSDSYSDGDDESEGAGGGRNGQRDRPGRAGDFRSADDRSGYDRSSDDRSGDDRSGDDRSGEDRSGDDRRGDGRSGNHRSGDDRSRYESSGDSSSDDVRSGSSRSSDSRSGHADGDSADRQSAGAPGESSGSDEQPSVPDQPPPRRRRRSRVTRQADQDQEAGDNTGPAAPVAAAKSADKNPVPPIDLSAAAENPAAEPPREPTEVPSA